MPSLGKHFRMLFHLIFHNKSIKREMWSFLSSRWDNWELKEITCPRSPNQFKNGRGKIWTDQAPSTHMHTHTHSHTHTHTHNSFYPTWFSKVTHLPAEGSKALDTVCPAWVCSTSGLPKPFTFWDTERHCHSELLLTVIISLVWIASWVDGWMNT